MLSTLYAVARPSVLRPSVSVPEYVFFVFFQISKKHDFLRFFEMTLKKRNKSVAKILSSMMLTLLQKKKKVC